MTELVHRAHARCEGCSKTYRVPDAERTYTCKACGGTVRAVAPPKAAHGHLEGAVTCKECHAVNHHGAHFCDECGALLESSEPLQVNEGEIRARQEAARALKRGYKWIGAITWLYRIGALAYAGMTFFAVLFLAQPDVPLEGGIVVVGLCTLMTVLMLMGAIQLPFRPFVWTVVVASAATLVTVAHLVGPNPLGLASLWSAGWAAAFWASVVPTRAFRRLMDEYTDTYILHHASRQTRRSVEGRSSKERHQRLVRAMQRANRHAWKVSVALAGAVCVASVIGTYVVCANVRPQQLTDALEGFETAWNAADFEAVAALYPAALKRREALRLAGITAGHGWQDSLPRLQDGQVHEGEEEVRVDYELEGITLSSTWTLDEQKWFLIEVDLPVPPFEPILERFLLAWRSSDAAGIAAFFPPDYQERMRESIERTAQRRGWQPYPEVLETDVTDYSSGETDVTLTLENGEVTTHWLIRGDGTWGLHSFQFPKL